MNRGTYGFPIGNSGRRLRRSTYDYIIAEQRLPASTYYGDVPAAATWFTRTLDVLAVDLTGIARLRSNQLRIPPGSYRVTGIGHGMYNHRHQMRVRDVTNGRTLALGIAPHAHTYTPIQVYSTCVGAFEAQSDITIELQQWAQSDHNQPWGLGHYGGGDPYEVAGQLELVRMRA